MSDFAQADIPDERAKEKRRPIKRVDVLGSGDVTLEESSGAEGSNNPSFQANLLIQAILFFKIYNVEQLEERKKKMEDFIINLSRPVPSSKLWLFYDPVMEKHQYDGYLEHPESPQRLRVIMDSLEASGILQLTEKVPRGRKLKQEEAEYVHGPGPWKELRKNSKMKKSALKKWNDEDGWNIFSLYFHKSTWNAVKTAVGGILQMLDCMVAGGGAGMAIVRPPGHHACIEEAHGFCFVNNIAIAVEYAVRTKNHNKVNLDNLAFQS